MRETVHPRTVTLADSFEIVFVVKGRIRLHGNQFDEIVTAGQTVFLPASLGAVSVESLDGESEILSIQPQRS